MKNALSRLKNLIGGKPFGEMAIRAELSELGERVDVLFFDEIDSTSLYARRLVGEGKGAPFLVVANSQSAGRGRLGRAFYSPADSGLYMTLALSIGESAVSITTRVCVALCRAIDTVFGIGDTKIKWVNDVYLGARKVAGILAESVQTPSGERVTLIGIGVNVSTSDFPPELDGIAASLGKDPSLRSKLCGAIVREVFSLVADTSAEYMDEYRARSLVKDKNVTYFIGGEERIGYVSAILDSGALEIITPNGEREILNSGEISLRLR